MKRIIKGTLPSSLAYMIKCPQRVFPIIFNLVGLDRCNACKYYVGYGFATSDRNEIVVECNYPKRRNKYAY